MSDGSNGRRGPAPRAALVGVKREDWRGQPGAAVGLGRELAERGEIAYCVIAPERRPPREQPGERRAEARERVRLRSAKVLDGTYRFLSEARICNRSREGLRLVLARDIALPPLVAVHVDETSEVREAKVVWRRGSTVGVRLNAAAPTNALKPCDRYALKERYYAIPA